MRTLLIIASILCLTIPAKSDTVRVAKTGAILCTLLSDAQIAFTYVKEGKQDRMGSLKGCWRVDPGTELVGLNIAGQYAWVAQDQGIISKGWTHVLWIEP